MVNFEKAKMKNELKPYGVLLEPQSEEDTNLRYKHTSQERDQSTGYDYMHFRFYASSMGRFLKPDNVILNAFNPQSWNLYTYVNGNPVNFNDPTGHQGEDPKKLPESGSDPNATQQGKEQVKEEQSGNKEKESNKPPQGAGDQCLEQDQSVERVNPITGQPGVSIGEDGKAGDIRTNLSNMKIGLFGNDARTSIQGTKKAHYGIDISVLEGTTVVAASSGEVIDVGKRGKAGLSIHIRVSDYCSINIYAHLSSIDVNKGQYVKTGDPIGKSGTTGNARGLPKDQQHLHFAVVNPEGQRVDPYIWLNEK